MAKSGEKIKVPIFIRRKGAEVFHPALAVRGLIDGLQVPVVMRFLYRSAFLQTVPFGYVIDETRHYQPDPLLAPYVEQTFQKYTDGATMTDLRDWLKAHNIKNTLGGEMSYNTIQRMLSNRRYIGKLRLRDVVQPNAIPALVSAELVGARPLHLAAQDRSVA